MGISHRASSCCAVWLMARYDSRLWSDPPAGASHHLRRPDQVDLLRSQRLRDVPQVAHVDPVQRNGERHVSLTPRNAFGQRRHHRANRDALELVLARRDEHSRIAPQLAGAVVHPIIVAHRDRHHVHRLPGVDLHPQTTHAGRVRISDNRQSQGSRAQPEAGMAQPVNVHGRPLLLGARPLVSRSTGQATPTRPAPPGSPR